MHKLRLKRIEANEEAYNADVGGWGSEIKAKKKNEK